MSLREARCGRDSVSGNYASQSLRMAVESGLPMKYTTHLGNNAILSRARGAADLVGHI